ncbi:MAG: STAS domain-containing protein [Bacteroidales bacterium]
MEFVEKKQGNILILELNGRLDTTNYTLVEKKINTLLDSGEKLFLINCEKLDYISSSGLRVLLALLKRLGQTNGKLVLCCLNENISEIFEIAGFSSIFNIKKSIEEGTTILS